MKHHVNLTMYECHLTQLYAESGKLYGIGHHYPGVDCAWTQQNSPSYCWNAKFPKIEDVNKENIHWKVRNDRKFWNSVVLAGQEQDCLCVRLESRLGAFRFET